MQQGLPVTIYKSWYGLAGIFLSALGSIGLVLWGFYEGMLLPGVDQMVLFLFAIFITALVVAFCAIWLRVYSLEFVPFIQSCTVLVLIPARSATVRMLSPF